MSSADLFTFQVDDIIFKKGDHWNGLYHIKKGVIEVFDGNDECETILDTLIEGEFLGTATLFSREPRTASARAKTEVVLQLLPADVISEKFKQMPGWISLIFKELITRLKRVNARVIKLESHETHQSLMNAAAIARVLSIYARNPDAKKRCVEKDVLLSDLEAILNLHPKYSLCILDIILAQKIIYYKDEPPSPLYHFPFRSIIEEFSAYALKSAEGLAIPQAIHKMMDLMSKEILALKKNKLIWTRSDIENIVSAKLDIILDESLWRQINSLPGIKQPEEVENAIEVESAGFLKIFAFENACLGIKKINPTHKV